MCDLQLYQCDVIISCVLAVSLPVISQARICTGSLDPSPSAHLRGWHPKMWLEPSCNENREAPGDN